MKIIPQHNILLKLNIFYDLIEYKDEQHPDSIFYYKNDKIYFELDKKNNTLWCNYVLVWNIFSNQKTLEYSETQRVIKDMVVKYTNWGSVTPISLLTISWNKVVKYTNWGSVTPTHTFNIRYNRWLNIPIGGQ